MKLDDFNYNLPKELIAQEPVRPRTNSNLMIIKKNNLEHKKFYNILNYLEKGDVLVINETKVTKARIKGKRETGAKIELMLEDKNNAVFKGRIRINDTLIFPKNIKAKILEKEGNRAKIKLNKPLKYVIDNIGELPVPPYVKKQLKDESQYQTAYAKNQGSLAAPTAGLHFNNELIKKIKDKGIKIAKLTLHVSWDTFLPIKDLKTHKMHGEECEINKTNAEIINKSKRLFVVGTTTLKALESLSKNNKIKPNKKTSHLFIKPGYKFNLKYTGLITNFHLPKSTLLMLVSAFLNKTTILKAYKEAVKNKYRFYSLGDATLLLKENSQPQ